MPAWPTSQLWCWMTWSKKSARNPPCTTTGRAFVEQREGRRCRTRGRRRPRSRRWGRRGCTRRRRASDRGRRGRRPPRRRRSAGGGRRARARRARASARSSAALSSATTCEGVSICRTSDGDPPRRSRRSAPSPRAAATPNFHTALSDPSGGRGSARRSGCAGSARCPPRSCTAATRGTRARSRRVGTPARSARATIGSPDEPQREVGDLLAELAVAELDRGTERRRRAGALGLGDAHLGHPPERFDARLEPADLAAHRVGVPARCPARSRRASASATSFRIWARIVMMCCAKAVPRSKRERHVRDAPAVVLGADAVRHRDARPRRGTARRSGSRRRGCASGGPRRRAGACRGSAR